MTEAEWLACDDIEQLFAFHGDRLSERKAQLLAVAHASLVSFAVVNAAVRAAMKVGLDFADGRVRRQQLRQSFQDANRAIWSEGPSRDRYWRCQAEAMRDVALGGRRALGAVIERVRVACEPAYLRPVEHFRAVLLDIVGNPFRPVAVDRSWLTSTVVALANGIYDERAFDRLPILADALMDAGCDHPDVLTHCRERNWEHVRGCWVVDLLLGKV